MPEEFYHHYSVLAMYIRDQYESNHAIPYTIHYFITRTDWTLAVLEASFNCIVRPTQLPNVKSPFL